MVSQTKRHLSVKECKNKNAYCVVVHVPTRQAILLDRNYHVISEMEDADMYPLNKAVETWPGYDLDQFPAWIRSKPSSEKVAYWLW